MSEQREKSHVAQRQDSASYQHQQQQQPRGDIAVHLLQAAAQASAAAEEDGSSSESDDGHGDGPDDHSPEHETTQVSGKRKKRSRACQACRQMKIRCNPVEGQDACLACAKVNRQCVMPGPAKKRQKTVHKVAELEKKINALTQSLLAKNAELTPQQSPAAISAISGSSTTFARNDSFKTSPPDPKLTYTASGMPTENFPFRDSASDSGYVDVVDRGLIDSRTATRVFDKFMRDMAAFCPLIAYPSGTTAEMVRRARPMTFLAIITTGSIIAMPDMFTTLTDELARQLSDRINFFMEKSLDLIQASLVQSIWVGKHRQAKDLGFNHYIHGAIVMAHELGIGKRSKSPLAKNSTDEAEMRRTWLACFYAGTCISTTLRQPAMIRSSPYIRDCLDFFAKSPAALPTDVVLCSLTELLLIMEDVANCFHMDDPQFTVNVEDAGTQYQLKAFEAQLAEWAQKYSQNMDSKLLKLLEPIASLYIHEISLHTDHNVDDFRPPGKNYNSEKHSTVDHITPSHVPAVSACVTAMKSALENFLAIFATATDIRALPCLYVVWTAYALVAMIRLHGSLRTTNSKYIDVFMPDLKIDYYLDTIIDKLTKEAGNCGPIPMFLHAFQKLKIWHQYRLMGVAVGQELAAAEDPKNGFLKVQDSVGRFVDSKGRVGTQSANGAAFSEPDVRGMNGNLLVNQQTLGHGQAANASTWSGSAPAQVNWYLPTTPQMPIDVSMFENQDWNFTMEDWTNFEASMSQPAATTGGNWLGYLL